MRIVAVVSKEDLLNMLADFTPVRIRLSSGSAERLLVIGKPAELALIPGQGVRILCPAKVRWSLSVLEVPVQVNSVQLLARPMIVHTRTGDALAFKLTVEEADLRGVPGLFDRKIVESINQALTSKNLLWNFTKTLTRTFRLPSALEPTDAIGLTAEAGEVRVTTVALVFTVSFQASVSRRRGEASPSRGPL
jgi:hypothetical protein